MKNLKKILLGILLINMIFVFMSCKDSTEIEMLEISLESDDINSRHKFYVAKDLISNDLYYKIMGEYYSYKGSGKEKVQKSWLEAIVFCNLLSEYMGYEPCYYYYNGKRGGYYEGENDISKWNLKDITRISSLTGWITCDVSKNGFRLPTPKNLESIAYNYIYNDLNISVDSGLDSEYILVWNIPYYLSKLTRSKSDEYVIARANWYHRESEVWGIDEGEIEICTYAELNNISSNIRLVRRSYEEKDK